MTNAFEEVERLEAEIDRLNDDNVDQTSHVYMDVQRQLQEAYGKLSTTTEVGGSNETI